MTGGRSGRATMASSAISSSLGWVLAISRGGRSKRMSAAAAGSGAALARRGGDQVQLDQQFGAQVLGPAQQVLGGLVVGEVRRIGRQPALEGRLRPTRHLGAAQAHEPVLRGARVAFEQGGETVEHLGV